jgi:hypothetical protein
MPVRDGRVLPMASRQPSNAGRPAWASPQRRKRSVAVTPVTNASNSSPHSAVSRHGLWFCSSDHAGARRKWVAAAGQLGRRPLLALVPPRAFVPNLGSGRSDKTPSNIVVCEGPASPRPCPARGSRDPPLCPVRSGADLPYPESVSKRGDRERALAEHERRLAEWEAGRASERDRNEGMHRRAQTMHTDAAVIHDRAADVADEHAEHIGKDND